MKRLQFLTVLAAQGACALVAGAQQSGEPWCSRTVVMKRKGGSRMLRQFALASLLLLTPSLVSAQNAKFQIEETTIEDIQAAILRGELTSTRLVQLYLNRIRSTTVRASISRMG